MLHRRLYLAVAPRGEGVGSGRDEIIPASLDAAKADR